MKTILKTRPRRVISAGLALAVVAAGIPAVAALAAESDYSPEVWAACDPHAVGQAWTHTIRLVDDAGNAIAGQKIPAIGIGEGMTQEDFDAAVAQYQEECAATIFTPGAPPALGFSPLARFFTVGVPGGAQATTITTDAQGYATISGFSGVSVSYLNAGAPVGTGAAQLDLQGIGCGGIDAPANGIFVSQQTFCSPAGVQPSLYWESLGVAYFDFGGWVEDSSGGAFNRAHVSTTSAGDVTTIQIDRVVPALSGVSTTYDVAVALTDDQGEPLAYQPITVEADPYVTSDAYSEVLNYVTGAYSQVLTIGNEAQVLAQQAEAQRRVGDLSQPRTFTVVTDGAGVAHVSGALWERAVSPQLVFKTSAIDGVSSDVPFTIDTASRLADASTALSGDTQTAVDAINASTTARASLRGLAASPAAPSVVSISLAVTGTSPVDPSTPVVTPPTVDEPKAQTPAPTPETPKPAIVLPKSTATYKPVTR